MHLGVHKVEFEVKGSLTAEITKTMPKGIPLNQASLQLKVHKVNDPVRHQWI